MRKTVALVVVLAFGVLGVVGAAAEASATTVAVKMKEFTLVPAPKTARPGKVTFVVKNVGKREHELLVVRTSVAPGKLPVNAKNRVSEKSAVGEVGDVGPGQTKRKTLTLAAGRYVLLCNLPGHYKFGQYSGFVVK